MTAICRIQSDGASLAALMAGEGTSVVFLHTAVCDKRMWQHQMKARGSQRPAIGGVRPPGHV